MKRSKFNPIQISKIPKEFDLGKYVKNITIGYLTMAESRFTNSLNKETHNSVKHEVWEDLKGLTTLCLADERGEDCRKQLEHDSKLIQTFYASCHYEAMTIYYKFMDWGIYTSEFEIDKEPYHN